MEVRNISQGGQAGFSNTNTSMQKNKVSEIETKAMDQASESNPANEKDLRAALDKLSKFIGNGETSIEYEYHSVFNDLMIKIINKETKEVILEVPPKKILDLVAKMMDMVGVLFDKKA